ncbi:LysR family transcriptional regulator [Alteromonas sediminis]|uniref:LysR family transcriptional regulator n=1 Tax=Alteromonas sediminis TaxID=2259342 RepID=A0A3N5Y2Z1_9ALTE|nr:LysR family transcriptional regulator [Alteromonas sediminis]RPJ67066.1 LysR family transcriptional regulator [Alteromonas sediminis]
MLKATLEQWRMFKAVVDAGGFNQAAQAVHKSQSSIHHAVQKLEQSLGVTLFENQGRRVSLTSQGEVLLRRATFLLDEAEKLERVAESLNDQADVQLRIAVDEIFPPDLLYQVLNKTSEAFPFLRIELMESILNGANELLQNGEVDMAISAYPIKDGFNEDLCDIEFVAVAHPDHPLHQQQRPVSYQDLKQYRQVVIRDSAKQQKKDAGWLGADQRWTVSHLRTSVDMISKGFGYAWLPVPFVEPLMERQLLKPLSMESGQIRSALLYLNFKDADTLGPAARDFIGQLRYALLSLPKAENVLGN